MTDQAGEQRGAEDRLDGWKRIAAYLNRDVRTVRRWEKHEGLPVRRLMHDRQSSVYAYRSELDDWLHRRGEQLARRTPQQRRMPGKPGWRWAWLAVPLLLAGALLVWLQRSDQEPAIAMGDWDWVLITEFENRTGEEILDGMVEYALQRALANSRFVKVVPPERAGDALRLMQLPPDTPIDIETGREISLRDGDIRALIAGRVEKAGNRYSVSADLINPADGVTLASFSEEAVGQDEILPAVGKMAGAVRSALGESLESIAESEEMLAKVTTPSLRALRLFSEANEAMTGADRIRAAPMLEEAVRIDPDFASAHLLLSYLYGERDEPERAAQHLERAVALAEHASERERLFILATYYGYLEDHAKAIETTHLLLRLYPDHFWAAGNLSAVYEVQGDFRESMDLKQRVAEIRPNRIDWWPDVHILQHAIALGDTEVRDEYLRRLESVADQPRFRGLSTLLLLWPVHEAWVNGAYEVALEKLEAIVAGLDPEAMVADGWLFAHIRNVYLALGKLDRFYELSAMREQLGWFQAVLDYDSGNPGTLDRYLGSLSTEFEYWDAVLMALAGQRERALAAIEDPNIRQPFGPPRDAAWKNLVRAQVALTEGRPEDVIALIGESTGLDITSKWADLFAMHAAARAFDDLGDLDRAIETLESARLQKPLMIFQTAGAYFWERNQLLLHDLYVRTGRDAAAREVEAELRDVLRLADPGHPFLTRLDVQAG